MSEGHFESNADAGHWAVSGARCAVRGGRWLEVDGHWTSTFVSDVHVTVRESCLILTDNPLSNFFRFFSFQLAAT